MKPSVHFSSASDEWETPPDLFARLDAEFHFTLDAAATVKTAKCARFLTKEDDALEADWATLAFRGPTDRNATFLPQADRGAVWVNPPYSRGLQARFLRKAQSVAGSWRGPIVVCLIPARPDTRVWHETVFPCATVRFLKGRVRFVGAVASAPFPSAVAIFGLDSPTVAVGWDWRA